MSFFLRDTWIWQGSYDPCVIFLERYLDLLGQCDFLDLLEGLLLAEKERCIGWLCSGHRFIYLCFFLFFTSKMM